MPEWHGIIRVALAPNELPVSASHGTAGMRPPCCVSSNAGQLALTHAERRALNGRMDVISAAQKLTPLSVTEHPPSSLSPPTHAHTHTHTHTHVNAYVHTHCPQGW